MLDIKLFRENPDLIRESERKRFRDTTNVEKVIEFDNLWRKTLQEITDLRRKRNELTEKIAETYKKAGKCKDKTEAEKLKKEAEINKEESKKIGQEIAEKEPKVEEYLAKRDDYRYKVGNILDPSTPVFQDEKDTPVLREKGKKPNFSFNAKNHVELVNAIGCVNLEKAAEIAGNRMYYLTNELVKLNLALLSFAVDILTESGYTPVWTPFFIKHEVIKEAAELADFAEQLYKIEGEDLYLIATSEQTLAALHRGDIIEEKKLPLKYCGVSSCFRKEAGSHGKDTLGIFRVHQFEKIEQFIYCKPEESPQMHENMISTSEKIFSKLKIPYRVINIVSSALNDNAAKKYDLEGWFPGSNAFRELVSCSNCTDYQARKLNVRFGTPGDKESWRVAHTLNSTAIATERTICCILENYQNEDGSVTIPEALVPYMGGITKIPARNK